MRKNENGRVPWLMGEKKLRPIWIHCASGEFEYAKPVISLIKRHSPQAKILVTYFSPSFKKSVHQYPGIDAACPLPWDQPEALQTFLEWHEPKALLIARTDTWPEMLRQCRMNNIPTLLFSATLPENSGRARGLGRWMSRFTFQFLDNIYCVTEEDAAVFKTLFDLPDQTGRVEVAGDTRYDQVIARLEKPKPLRAELWSDHNRDRCFIAGSTWPEDEKALLQAFKSEAIAKQLRSGELKVILVPHEPTPSHLKDLERQLSEIGLHGVRYSSAANWSNGTVLLIDQIGILAELYLRARFAFVGGSFRKTVHSVMEPLAAGCLTFVGPFYRNNREAIEFNTIRITNEPHEFRAVEAVQDASALESRLLGALNLPASAIDQKIKGEILRRTGKSEKVLAWCAQRGLFDRT